MAERGVVILGAGGHARVVAEAIGARGVIGHVSRDGGDAPTDPLLGERLGSDDDARGLIAQGHAIAIGVGFVERSGAVRRAAILGALDGVELATVCHADATISPSAHIDEGCYVGPRAVVGTGAALGRGVIVNTGAIVDHDCEIGANVHVAPGAAISGAVTIGADTLIGVGARVIQGVQIGSGVIVGAGAVVVDDVPDDVTVVGVPARVVD